jgi:hypothetical protein
VIFAVAGTSANANAAVRFLELLKKLPWDDPGSWDHRDVPSLEDSIIMAAHRDGRVFAIEEQGWFQTTAEFWALGSGAMAALAAMHMRESA